MKSVKSNQSGFSFSSFLVIAVVLIVVSIFGMKLIPAYMNNAEIQHLFKDVANDPTLKNASVAEIRTSYMKRAGVEGVSNISPDDVDISTDEGIVSLSAKYSVKIPFAGNITLLLEFNPSSSS